PYRRIRASPVRLRRTRTVIPSVDVMTRKLCHLIILIALTLLALAAWCSAREVADPQYQSAFLRVSLASDQPAFVVLAVDSLGRGWLDANPLWPPAPNSVKYFVKRTRTKVEYRVAGAARTSSPAWSFEFFDRSIELASNYSATAPPAPVLLNFN